MPLQAVLFDVAGTLIHVREPVGVTYGRIARAHGVAAGTEVIDRAFRTTIRAMPPMVFPGASAAATISNERAWWRELVQRVFAVAAPDACCEDFAAFFDAVFAHFAQPSAWLVGEDALVTLRALRERKLRTGVVSNFDHRLPALLDGLGLATLFDVVVRPADAGAAKPDARIFHVALDRLGVAPHDALYVGDDEEEDVRGAEAAGLRAVNVGTLRPLSGLLEYVAMQ